MKKVAFRLADGVNRVVLAIAETGEHLTVDGEFETSDPFEIAALDAHAGVERASARPKSEKAEAPKGDA